MEKKTLEKLHHYIHVIQKTCDRYGWDGLRAQPVRQEAVLDFRRFFEYLQTHIPLKEIPNPEDTMGNQHGAISILWETELDPVKVSYDTFEIEIDGENRISYRGNLESISTKVCGETPLEPELCEDIIEHIRFFKRRLDEQEQIQRPTALKPAANK